MIRLAHNLTHTTATMDALKSLNFKPAKHKELDFITRGDDQMIVVESYQRDTHVDSKVMLGNSKKLITGLVEDCEYLVIYRDDIKFWKQVVAIQDTNSGHTTYLGKGAK